MERQLPRPMFPFNPELPGRDAQQICTGERARASRIGKSRADFHEIVSQQITQPTARQGGGEVCGVVEMPGMPVVQTLYCKRCLALRNQISKRHWADAINPSLSTEKNVTNALRAVIVVALRWMRRTFVAPHIPWRGGRLRRGKPGCCLAYRAATQREYLEDCRAIVCT